MYENGKMRPAKTIPGLRGVGIKENDGGGDFNYDKCKCYNVPQVKQ
jgi:hypothetical protein